MDPQVPSSVAKYPVSATAWARRAGIPTSSKIASEAARGASASTDGVYAFQAAARASGRHGRRVGIELQLDPVARTHSLVLAYQTKQVRFVDTVHMFDRDGPPRVHLWRGPDGSDAGPGQAARDASDRSGGRS